MTKKIADTATCHARENTCEKLKEAAEKVLQDYKAAMCQVNQLKHSIEVHNGWTQGSNIAGAGFGVASGILWILTVPTLGATAIPAMITTGCSVATSGGAFVGDLVRSPEFLARTKEISDSFKAREVEFSSWLGAQHLADYVIHVRAQIDTSLNKKKKDDFLQEQFQPLGEVTCACALANGKWLTMERRELIQDIKVNVFDACHELKGDKSKLPLIAVNEENELLGMVTVTKRRPCPVDVNTYVATVDNVRKLHDSAKGVAKILYTQAFQAVAAQEDIVGIYIHNAASTPKEKEANLKGMLFAAGVCGYPNVINAKSKESVAERLPAKDRDGNIDPSEVNLLLFMK